MEHIENLECLYSVPYCKSSLKQWVKIVFLSGLWENWKKVQLSFHNVAEHSKRLCRSRSGEALKSSGMRCYIFDIDTLETLAWFNYPQCWIDPSICYLLMQALLHILDSISVASLHPCLSGCWCSSKDPGDSGPSLPWSLLQAVDGRIDLGFCDSLFSHVFIGEV